MKIIIKSFLCIYFMTLAGLSVVALMKCIVETDSLSSKIKGPELKCPFYQQEISNVLSLFDVKSVLATPFQYLDSFSSHTLNILVLSGYVTVGSTIMTILYLIFRIQFGILQKVLSLALQAMVVLFLVILVASIFTNQELRESYQNEFSTKADEVMSGAKKLFNLFFRS